MNLKIYDATGVERSHQWLTNKYGSVGLLVSDGNPYFDTVEFHEKVEAPATLVVTLRENSTPIVNTPVSFWWPDGNVSGNTNENGDVGFGMGHGAYYWPSKAKGPHWISCMGVTVDGLGMLAGTNHDHLDVVLVKTNQPDPPDPPDPPKPPYGDLEEILERLDRIIELLELIQQDK